jgi:4-hydroxy-3-methylbut-2-enyl diphosphate reductase
MVKVAKSAGFCFGVNRAVDKVYELCDENKKVYTWGPIIHNENVVGELERKGVQILNSIEDARKISEGVIVIRSHGIDRHTDESLRSISKESEGKIDIFDATCPFVKKIHRKVEEASRNGKFVIIAGDETHPEVEGILGWCEGESAVVDSVEKLAKIDLASKKNVCLVSQTTYNYKKFKDLVDFLEKKGYSRSTSVDNTICNATEERQTEARELAAASDLMIVIGSPSSSNSRKLYEISSGYCNKTYFIQDAEELDGMINELSAYKRIGITAGASTPHNIIEEVHRTMEENVDFEQMLEESLKSIHNGEVVEGTVIDVKEDEIVLNIGYKADGIISRSEYTKDNSLDLTTVVKPGDVLKAKVVKVNDGDGQVLLSTKRVINDRVSQVIQDAFDNKTVLTGKVVEVVKGGINVLVDDTKVFIPASLVSDTFEKDLTKFQNQEIEFNVIEYNPKKRRVIGDRKTLVAAQKAAKQAAALADIIEGDVFEGTVKNITDFGVFVDIGDVDGLLHVTEMSWVRTGNPKKLFKVGDKVRVFVKSIKGNKIALSKKFDDENPWADAETKFAVGNVVTGKVARMADFGAFVELEPGVDALLHVSQISKDRIEKPSDVLSVGQEITAEIVDFRPEEKKISLSMKKLIKNEEPAAEAATVETEE